MQEVKVIIPVYRTEMSQHEEVSLRQTFQVLGKHPITIVCPEGLDIECILEEVPNRENIGVERFDPQFFKGIKGYNSLMLSETFYERFLSSKYILICQTDAYVFRDDLLYWCQRGYDYIGAPWLGSKETWLSGFLRSLDNAFRVIKGKKKRNWDHLFKVGNGGFSLRKVESFYNIATQYKELITTLKDDSKSIYAVEDVFWSLKAPLLQPDFKIPDYQEAVSFAIDRKPDIAIKFNNGELPFACHGFDKPKVKEFWEKYIPLVAK